MLAILRRGSIVYGVAFSRDGTRLAAVCRNNAVRLIDVARSPDGSRLASGSGDFPVRVWDSLSPQERMKRTRADSPR